MFWTNIGKDVRTVMELIAVVRSCKNLRKVYGKHFRRIQNSTGLGFHSRIFTIPSLIIDSIEWLASGTVL